MSNLQKVLKSLNEIEENDKFPTRVSWGTDYKNMKDITEKFE